jgi:phasin family protein
MAVKKSPITPVRAAAAAKPVATPVAAAKVVPAKPVAAKPVVSTPIKTVATPIEEAQIMSAAAIEDVAGISPAVEKMTKTIKEMPKRVAEVVTEIKKTQTEVNTQMEKAMKSAEEFVAFGQGNIEAFVKSSQIWATGMQDLSKHFAASAQASIDETVASVKALSSVKSFKEAMDLQTSMTKTAMEKMMAETGKLTDASVKLAEQALAPLTARVTLATEKFTKAA